MGLSVPHEAYRASPLTHMWLGMFEPGLTSELGTPWSFPLWPPAGRVEIWNATCCSEPQLQYEDCVPSMRGMGPAGMYVEEAAQRGRARPLEEAHLEKS